MRRATLLLAVATLCWSEALLASSSGDKDRTTHQVYSGQTLGMIARRYNVSIAALCEENGITRKTRIKPKQILRIPGRASDTAAARVSSSEPATGKTVPAALRKAESKAARQSERQSSGRTRGAYAKRPARRGYLTLTSYSGTFRGQIVDRNGQLVPGARAAFERVLASWRTGKREPIHGRLIRLLARVSDHFGGRPIRVVSGYRPYSPRQYTPHSRHNLGRAVDFSIEGVPNSVVRDYCLTLGNVGVGYYPNSTFVHLDVRDVPTQWVDYSGPGERPRYANAREPEQFVMPNVTQPAAFTGSTRSAERPFEAPAGASVGGGSVQTQQFSPQAPEIL